MSTAEARPVPLASGYVPQPYGDELLLSFVARWHRHMGSPPRRPFLQSVFGASDVRAAFDLPNHLDALADRLPPRAGLDVGTLIDGMTLFPYLTAFVPHGTRGRVRQAMRGRGPPSPNMLLGLGAFDLRVERLRFCRACNAAMEQDHGELHWRRSFQVASAVVCPDHEEPLRLSAVATTASARLEFTAATRTNCREDAESVADARDAGAMRRLADLAAAGARLLDGLHPSGDLGSVVADYRERLRRKGFRTGDGATYLIELSAALNDFWGDVLRSWPSLAPIGPEQRFPRLLLGRSERPCMPLQHLLLAAFLDHRPDRAEPEPSPIGPGPWPCLNPLADHVGRAVVTDCTSSRRGRWVLRCGCGYAYSRTLTAAGALGRPWTIEWGPLAKRYLRRCASGKVSITEAAARMGVNFSTVKLVALKLGVELGRTTYAPHTRSMAARRRRGEASGALRGKSSGAPSVGRKGRPPRDLTALDEELSRLLPRKRVEILSRDPPVRVTAGSLLEGTPASATIMRRSLDRLPLTRAMWPCLQESGPDWRRRRAGWAAERLLAAASTLSDEERRDLMQMSRPHRHARRSSDRP